MSEWSYITGWLKCEPMGRTQEEKEYILKTVLNHLPVVQGSEEDMYVHIIKAGGYDTSCSDDEYGDRTNNLKEMGYGEFRRSRNGRRRTQSIYYIFIEGHLRDRSYIWTYKQFTKWLTRFAKRIPVKDTNIIIDNTFVHKPLIMDNFDFESLFEEPSWAHYDKEFKYITPYQDYDFNWSEHLMW